MGEGRHTCETDEKDTVQECVELKHINSCTSHAGQTYANKELVIVDDGEDDTLAQWVREVNDPQVVMVRLPSEGKPLGELRNVAVERARGCPGRKLHPSS